MFLVFCLLAFINIKHVADGDIPANSNFPVALIFLSVCVAELVAVSIFFKVRYSVLDEERSKKRCGYIFEDINYKIRGGWALSYPIIY